MKRPEQRPVVLVYGESDNDRRALLALALALCPETPFDVQARRAPLVLMRDADQARLKKRGAELNAAVRRESAPVAAVIAHEDCDAVEPAHVDLIEKIAGQVSASGVPCVVAAPAFEMEAWLYLWPEAVAAVNSKWRRLSRTGAVGLLVNAKETLTRDLRPANARTPDYSESDCPRVANKVRELGIVDAHAATSASFDAFASAWRGIQPAHGGKGVRSGRSPS